MTDSVTKLEAKTIEEIKKLTKLINDGLNENLEKMNEKIKSKQAIFFKSI